MKIADLPDRLDLGDGRYLEFTVWHGDDVVGAIETHRNLETGQECAGAIHFDVPECPSSIPQNHRWTVESWNPLTVSPSLLCRFCGNHGFIRQGKWVAA